jgi:hypothetical protein
MRIASLILPLLMLALSGCNREPAVPTPADNQAMDAASNRLDKAADELDRVDEQLPATNENGSPAEASDPPKP